VIELWVDNVLMLEMLTPEMQREYQDNVTIENWREMLPQVFKIAPDGEPIDDAKAA
jgi:hypothetical protein